MNRFRFGFFLVIVFLLLHTHSIASHIYGADFFYKHLGGTSYRITLTVYGDCGGAAFPNLASSSPQVEIFKWGFSQQVINLNLTGPGVEVTPVCPSEINNTSCNGGTVPGVKRYIYSANININDTSSAWLFRFTGSMGASTQAGRSNSITNIVFGANGGSVTVLEAALNNTLGPNSSPQFTTIPTPFYCINVQQQYNQGAIDTSIDVLSYSLAPGLETSGASIVPVTYQFGFSATNPLSASNFSFNTSTGQMSFIPNQIQKSLVVNKVTEYRNGVIVGTASREMTFVVLSNCNNSPPSGNIDTAASTLQGAMVNGTNVVNVCVGTPAVHFSIFPHTITGDTIQTFSIVGLPAGATINVTGNNTPNPSLSFNWNTTNVAAGSYTFYITYKGIACPLVSQQTQAYTIHVIRPNEMTTAIVSPTQCVHKALIQYNFAYGLVPRNIVIKQGGTVVSSFTDTSGHMTDSLAAGTYTVIITSAKLLCPTQYTLVVPDGGVYPFPPIVPPVFYCKDDVPGMLTAIPAPGAILRWYDAFGNYLPVAPVPNTATTGIFTWLVSQKYLVCESKKDTAKVYVTQRPVASIASLPEICTVDTALISFNGSVGLGPIISYVWDWDGANYTSGSDDGPWHVKWDNPGLKTITLKVLENLCPSFPDTQLLLVKPTPVAAFTAKDICIYDTLEVLYTANPLDDQHYAWHFDEANIRESNERGPFMLHWTNSGVKHLLLQVSKDGCVGSLARDVHVNPAPEAVILNKPVTLCYGDKINLLATGGISYQWLPLDKTTFDFEGNPIAYVLTPTTYTVIARNEFDCIDSDKVTYSSIEPCCNFSYPTAFTPNSDGRNDQFRVIMYGNKESFSLSIYDRWGERVFLSVDPKAGWDGTVNGQPGAPGTYFYYVKAKCLTGHEEEHKGDVLLIR